MNTRWRDEYKPELAEKPIRMIEPGKVSFIFKDQSVVSGRFAEDLSKLLGEPINKDDGNSVTLSIDQYKRLQKQIPKHLLPYKALLQKQRSVPPPDPHHFYVGGMQCKDKAKAVRLLARAAELGHAAAQSELGFIYRNGNHVQKDEKKAVAYFMQAAEGGNSEAQYELGRVYKKGDFVVKDEKIAADLFARAAIKGYAAANYELGWLYVVGKGVAKNKETADQCFELAEKQGFKPDFADDPMYNPVVGLENIHKYKILTSQFSIDLVAIAIKRGIEQRFVINFVIDAKNETITNFFIPTYDEINDIDTKGLNDVKKKAFEVRYQKSISELKEIYKTKHGSCLIGVPYDARIRGVAHKKGAEVSLIHDPEYYAMQDYPRGGWSGTLGGLYICRSTKNWDIFTLHLLAKYSLYYYPAQNNFIRRWFSLSYYLSRSLSTVFATKLFETTLPQINDIESKSRFLDNDVIKFYENHWDEMKANPRLLSERIMRTIYIASGQKEMAGMDFGVFPTGHHPPNFEVIKGAIEAAKNAGIELDFDCTTPGDNFDEKVARGATALIHAAANNDTESVQLLLNVGASVDFQDRDGQTALFMAVKNGNLKMITILLTMGANLNLVDKYGITPFTLANHYDHFEVCYLLLSAKENKLSKSDENKDPSVKGLQAQGMFFVSQVPDSYSQAYKILSMIKKCEAKDADDLKKMCAVFTGAVTDEDRVLIDFLTKYIPKIQKPQQAPILKPFVKQLMEKMIQPQSGGPLPRV